MVLGISQDPQQPLFIASMGTKHQNLPSVTWMQGGPTCHKRTPMALISFSSATDGETKAERPDSRCSKIRPPPLPSAPKSPKVPYPGWMMLGADL